MQRTELIELGKTELSGSVEPPGSGATGALDVPGRGTRTVSLYDGSQLVQSSSSRRLSSVGQTEAGCGRQRKHPGLAGRCQRTRPPHLPHAHWRRDGRWHLRPFCQHL